MAVVLSFYKSTDELMASGLPPDFGIEKTCFRMS